MPFRTAIFYDIENLLKGYHAPQALLESLSLAEILQGIKGRHALDGIALQRAYANWSDPRLGAMRMELNELGIDPIQVFGFSRDVKKNAADIQLAIDAIDLAHVRPQLEIFVIVSGDGGFAALAKKLHEYGKTVIGAAYRSATNQTFRSVCDGFVSINEPLAESSGASPQPEAVGVTLGKHSPNDPRNVRLCQEIAPLPPNSSRNAIVDKTRKIIAWYGDDPTCRNDLLRSGIFLAVLQDAVKHLIPDFQQIKLGFVKFVEYIQYACKDTDFCVVRSPNLSPVLALRDRTPENWEVLADLPERELHGLENYRRILANGTPVLRLPEPSTLHGVVDWLVQQGHYAQSFGEWLEQATDASPYFSGESVHMALVTLVNAEVFLRESPSSVANEQILRLRPDMTHTNLVLTQVTLCVEKKIAAVLTVLDTQIMAELLPAVTT